MNYYEKSIEDGVFKPLKEEPISLIIEEIDLDDAICYKTQDYCKNNSLTKSEQLLLYDFGDYLMEYLFDKLKEVCKKREEEDVKMSNRWSKKTENTVQDFDGEECNIDEIVGGLNYYQKKVDSLNKENEELKASKEYWKGECLSNGSLNQILRNELDIAQ